MIGLQLGEQPCSPLSVFVLETHDTLLLQFFTTVQGSGDDGTRDVYEATF